MTQISGSLIRVTENPAAVNEVLVRAHRLRTTSNAVVTTEPDRYQVTNGQVSFPCAPGPAVLVLITGGIPVATVPIVVADAESMTLQDAVAAAELVDTSTRSQLEQLATDAMRAVEAASAAAAAASAAKQSEMNAESSASSAAAAASAANNAAGTATTKASEASDAAASAIAAAASVTQFQGHGFPNGKVAAPVGSIYTDLDATAGAIRWIKTSGTGNTGWKVEYGDTGWRNVTALATNIVTGYGAIFFRRFGVMNTITFDIKIDPASAASKVDILPGSALLDWAPVAAVSAKGWATQENTGTTFRAMLTRLGTFTLYGVPTNAVLNGQIMWPSDRTWGTTLPGTPA